ncbi:HNH endonuclease [Oceanobacillus chungangensis]|uniref:Putative HNH nuclease YajD n=1 Tax=Oceanobacillus chungangensis TaxID=1229152 RepID=A0A3D8PIN0_9BACI|nr:HNH endonuclease signature motif containing protein [Oceanobacillus chungangensis]RDW15953.1 alpha/beta hydrolase [Oceanobacillus chungangensis]
MAEYKTIEQKKKFYKGKEWQDIRQQVLVRDNYECRMCKELGYVTVRDQSKLDVDHIKSIEHHPELALELENLQLLCVRHHNEKEGRVFKRKINKWENDERW